MRGALNAVTSGLQHAGRASTCVLLLGLFLVVFVVVLLLVSALQLHHSVETAAVQNVRATVGQVRLDVILLNARDQQAQANNDALSQTRARREQYAATMQQARVAMTRSARQAQVAVEVLCQIYPKLGTIRPASNWVEKPIDALFEFSTAVRQRALEKGVKQQIVDEMLTKVAEATAPPLQKFADAWEVYQEAKGRDDLAEEREKDLASALPPLTGPLADEAYRNIVEDYRAYEHVFGSFVYQIVLLPNSILVLLLAIFMGMLGSLIYVARDIVLNNASTEPGEILFRIGLGAAVALALFFFASAGVLAMSQTSSDSVDMSPYLISFFGITGGYLSDHVTAWMREMGEKAFKLEKNLEPDRWAIGLDSALTAQNLAVDAVATAIGAEAEDIAAWRALERSIPVQRQKALALYLRVDASRLFTDLAPAASPVAPVPTASA